jgi:hypothetical protein
VQNLIGITAKSTEILAYIYVVWATQEFWQFERCYADYVALSGDLPVKNTRPYSLGAYIR